MVFFFLNVSSTNYLSDRSTYIELKDSINHWNNIAINSIVLHPQLKDNYGKLKEAVFLSRLHKAHRTEQIYKQLIFEPGTDIVIQTHALVEYLKALNSKKQVDTINFVLEYFNRKISILPFSNLDKIAIYTDIDEATQATDFTLPVLILQKGLQVFKDEKVWDKHLRFTMMLIRNYRDKSDYVNAHNVYTGAANLYKNVSQLNNEKILYDWAFEIYEPIGDSLRSYRDIKRAIYLSKKSKDDAWLAEHYNNMARYYRSCKKYNSALVYLDSSLVLNTKLKNVNRMGINELNRGSCYLELKDYSKSVYNFNLAIKHFTITSFYIGLGFSYVGLLQIDITEKNKMEARKHVEKARLWAEKANYHCVFDQLYPALSSYYTLIGRVDSSMYYTKLHVALQKKIYSPEKLTQITKQEIQAKEEEINYWINKNTETENSIFKIQVSKEKEYILIISLFVFFVLASYFILRRIRKMRGLITEISKETNTITQKNSLPEKQDIDLAESFQALVQSEKLYLNEKFSLEDAATHLKTNKTYLSKAINTVHSKRFSNLINEYRIEESMLMLSDSKFDNLSIEGIASAVGFSSKSSFNRTFKEQTGLTPSEFKSKRVNLKNI